MGFRLVVVAVGSRRVGRRRGAGGAPRRPRLPPPAGAPGPAGAPSWAPSAALVPALPGQAQPDGSRLDVRDAPPGPSRAAARGPAGRRTAGEDLRRDRPGRRRPWRRCRRPRSGRGGSGVVGQASSRVHSGDSALLCGGGASARGGRCCVGVGQCPWWAVLCGGGAVPVVGRAGPGRSSAESRNPLCSGGLVLGCRLRRGRALRQDRRTPDGSGQDRRASTSGVAAR